MTMKITTLGELADALFVLARVDRIVAEETANVEMANMMGRGGAPGCGDALEAAEQQRARLRATPVQFAALLPAELCEAMAAHLSNTAQHPAETTSPSGHASWLAEVAADAWKATK